MKYDKYVPVTAKLIENKDFAGRKVDVHSVSGAVNEPGEILFGPYIFTYTTQEKAGERTRPKEHQSCETYLVKLKNNKILQFAKEELKFI
jgi:hypothetical protein